MSVACTRAPCLSGERRKTLSIYYYTYYYSNECGIFTTHFSLTLVASGRYLGFVLVLWLKLPAWKVGDSGCVPRFGIQVSKKKLLPRSLEKIQYCAWGATVTKRWRARPQTVIDLISNPVPGHLIYFTILRRFSGPSLAYMCTKRPKTLFIHSFIHSFLLKSSLGLLFVFFLVLVM